MNKHKTILVIFMLLVPLSGTTQPAIYRDGALSVDNGAVILSSGNVYYTNIELTMETDGKLVATAAEELPLVPIETVDVSLSGELLVQASLSISGNKSVPCVSLMPPAISFRDNHFEVVLAESKLGPEESCIAVIEPFTTSVDLDTTGLTAGEYSISVNGVDASFTLISDNP